MLASVPFVVGSSCVVLFSSGDSDKDDKEDDETFIVTGQGSFADTPVQGLGYASGELTGVTDSQGGFRYERGKQVQFAIGDIVLGEPVSGEATITPVDLAPSGTANSTAAVNIARLLQSLDSDPADDSITIPAEVAAKATRDNSAVSAAIEFLDFKDETAFVNAASQLVAVLTADYDFTATLVDARDALKLLPDTTTDDDAQADE
jgi:hypothetical protein